MNFADSISGGLIVSCQAPEGSPLRDPIVMTAMARAAEQAGAAGIRAQGRVDIAAIRGECALPMIGIVKRSVPGSDVYITPCISDARDLADLGVEIVATDMTGRERPGGEDVRAIVDFLHARDVAVMADVASVDQGIAAVDCGADLVGTTFTPHFRSTDDEIRPDFGVLEGLVKALPNIPIIAEGGYSRPSDVKRALEIGAHCVVVGRAITDALALSEDFVAAATR